MSKYANLTRFDLSNYLIHFVRPLNAEADDVPQLPVEWGWGNLAEDGYFSPFFLLRCIVRHGRLWGTWSIRNGRRTVYGPRPAVCFTEMPLAAFVQASQVRGARGEKISPYGLIFPKRLLFAAGARPAIYGLSVESQAINGAFGQRLLDERVLAGVEQYRFVAYSPEQRGPDWTHEREWRWPSDSIGGAKGNSDDPPITWEDIPGLDFYEASISDLGIIVPSAREADLLVHDILRLADQGRISKRTFRFILTLDGLPPVENLWKPADVAAAITKNTIDVAPYFEVPGNAKKLVEKFNAVVSRIAREARNTDETGEPGECWLWLYDNKHPLVRALVRDPYRITINSVGRYLVWLREFGDEIGLRRREEFTKKLAETMRAEFDLPSGYFSVLFSSDPDAVPFYCDVMEDEDLFFNVSVKE